MAQLPAHQPIPLAALVAGLLPLLQLECAHIAGTTLGSQYTALIGRRTLGSIGCIDGRAAR